MQAVLSAVDNTLEEAKRNASRMRNDPALNADYSRQLAAEGKLYFEPAETQAGKTSAHKRTVGNSNTGSTAASRLERKQLEQVFRVPPPIPVATDMLDIKTQLNMSSEEYHRLRRAETLRLERERRSLEHIFYQWLYEREIDSMECLSEIPNDQRWWLLDDSSIPVPCPRQRSVALLERELEGYVEHRRLPASYALLQEVISYCYDGGNDQRIDGNNGGSSSSPASAHKRRSRQSVIPAWEVLFASTFEYWPRLGLEPAHVLVSTEDFRPPRMVQAETDALNDSDSDRSSNLSATGIMPDPNQKHWPLFAIVGWTPVLQSAYVQIKAASETMAALQDACKQLPEFVLALVHKHCLTWIRLSNFAGVIPVQDILNVTIPKDTLIYQAFLGESSSWEASVLGAGLNDTKSGSTENLTAEKLVREKETVFSPASNTRRAAEGSLSLAWRKSASNQPALLKNRAGKMTFRLQHPMLPQRKPNYYDPAVFDLPC
jgi:hypothetical protein